jgi:hypothetical protein
MSDLSRDDIVWALGPVDEARIIEIMESDVDLLQFAEARVWFVHNKAMAESGIAPRQVEGPVGHVLEILERIDAEQGLDDFGKVKLQPE